MKLNMENGIDPNRRLLEEELKRKENVSSERQGNVENAKEEKQSIWAAITEHMDLALLKDARYVAVILGNFFLTKNSISKNKIFLIRSRNRATNKYRYGFDGTLIKKILDKYVDNSSSENR